MSDNVNIQKKLHPFFGYFGSMWRLSKRYPQPRYTMIIEPFAGSAGYSLHYPDHDVLLNDKYDVIWRIWDYLIHADPDEIRALPDVGNDQTINDITWLTQAQRELIGFWLNRMAQSPRSTPCAWMRSGVLPRNYWGGLVRGVIADQIPYIRHWTATCMDYRDLDNVEATWFIDPPYTRWKNQYKHSDIDYSELADWCRSRRGQVIVCEMEGADWLQFETLCDVRGGAHKRGRITREVYWAND